MPKNIILPLQERCSRVQACLPHSPSSEALEKLHGDLLATISQLVQEKEALSTTISHLTPLANIAMAVLTGPAPLPEAQE